MTPENNIPFDIEAHLAWLKEQARGNKYPAVRKLTRLQLVWMVIRDPEVVAENMSSYLHFLCRAEEATFNRVIAHIENIRVNQKPKVPAGWDEV